jgi:uncharacterized membrane protein YidH (DUF202 family)
MNASGPSNASDRPGADDRSLAAERTTLAWQRTGLVPLVAGIALLRIPSASSGAVIRIIVGWALLLTGVAAWLLGFIRFGAVSRSPRHRPPAAALRFLALATAGLALGTLILSASSA